MPFSAAKYSSLLLDHVQEDTDLQRIQASVHTRDKQAIRYVEWLGFENEGLMKKFGPDGSDYYRFARVA
jgi:RimJ/RimL family protein N-acetyltransferase